MKDLFLDPLNKGLRLNGIENKTTTKNEQKQEKKHFAYSEFVKREESCDQKGKETPVILLYPRHLFRAVYSFCLSIRYVHSFIHSSVLFVE